jgi:adenylate kinase family enzyme
MNTKVVNIIGGPGLGKTTTAMKIASEMSIDHDVQLIQEVAKNWVWKGLNVNTKKGKVDQLHLLGSQNHKQFNLIGKTEYVITDSPLFLSDIYKPDGYYENFHPLTMEVFFSYTNINVVIDRNVGNFQSHGRNHNFVESQTIHEQIKKFVVNQGIPHLVVNLNESSWMNECLQYIKNH